MAKSKSIRIFKYDSCTNVTFASVLSYFDMSTYEKCIRDAVKGYFGKESLPMKVRYNGPGGTARCLTIDNLFFVVGSLIATKPNANELYESYNIWFEKKLNLKITDTQRHLFKEGVMYAALNIAWLDKSGSKNDELTANAINYHRKVNE